MTRRKDVATISVRPATKERLADLKALDGEESWDHELNRLHRLYKAAEARGLLQELLAA